MTRALVLFAHPVPESFSAALHATVVETLEVESDEARIEWTRRVVERVWQAIEAVHSWPNPSPMNCPSCPRAVRGVAWLRGGAPRSVRADRGVPFR